MLFSVAFSWLPCRNIYFYFTSFHASPNSNPFLSYLLPALKRTFSDRKCLLENHICRLVLPENIFKAISVVPLFSKNTEFFKEAQSLFSAALAAAVVGWGRQDGAIVCPWSRESTLQQRTCWAGLEPPHVGQEHSSFPMMSTGKFCASSGTSLGERLTGYGVRELPLSPYWARVFCMPPYHFSWDCLSNKIDPIHPGTHYRSVPVNT